MKQRETTVLLGILAMFSFCMGHACTSVNDFWSEPIILWIAVVLPTGKSVFILKFRYLSLQWQIANYPFN